MPDSFVKGLQLTKWAGRAEVIHDPSGRLSFYIDGAHSPESMEACANWFCSRIKHEETTEVVQSSSNPERWNSKGFIMRRVLLFNCMPKRDPVLLLQPVINLCSKNGFPIHAAFFVPPYSSYTSVGTSHQAPTVTDATWQHTLQRHWESLWRDKLTDGSGFACLSRGERREPEIELLSTLKDASECNPQHGNMLGPSSAVLRSLPSALDHFRNCLTHHPQLRVQVLVTGSLYLVGDLLKLLKR